MSISEETFVTVKGTFAIYESRSRFCIYVETAEIYFKYLGDRERERDTDTEREREKEREAERERDRERETERERERETQRSIDFFLVKVWGRNVAKSTAP